MKVTDSQSVPSNGFKPIPASPTQLEIQAVKGGDLATVEAGEINPTVTVPGQTSSSRPGKKQLVIGAIAIGLLALLGITGGRWWQFASTHEETDNATVTGPIHPISTRFNGNVAEILVKDNQPVQAGQFRHRVAGAYVMPPLERYEAALEVLDGFLDRAPAQELSA